MEEVRYVIKDFLRNHYKYYMMIALILMGILPLFVSFDNLDSTQSALMLERLFTILGLILLLPLYFAETDYSIWIMIKIRQTPYSLIILIRMLIQVLVLIGMLTAWLLLLQNGHSEFDFWLFWRSELATVLFLASLGYGAFSLSQQPILSTVVPIMYYVLCFASSSRYLGNFYLFGLTEGNITSKLLLFVFGLLLFGCSLYRLNRRSA